MDSTDLAVAPSRAGDNDAKERSRARTDTRAEDGQARGGQAGQRLERGGGEPDMRDEPKRAGRVTPGPLSFRLTRSRRRWSRSSARYHSIRTYSRRQGAGAPLATSGRRRAVPSGRTYSLRMRDSARTDTAEPNAGRQAAAPTRQLEGTAGVTGDRTTAAA